MSDLRHSSVILLGPIRCKIHYEIFNVRWNIQDSSIWCPTWSIEIFKQINKFSSVAIMQRLENIKGFFWPIYLIYTHRGHSVELQSTTSHQCSLPDRGKCEAVVHSCLLFVALFRRLLELSRCKVHSAHKGLIASKANILFASISKSNRKTLNTLTRYTQDVISIMMLVDFWLINAVMMNTCSTACISIRTPIIESFSTPVLIFVPVQSWTFTRTV